MISMVQKETKDAVKFMNKGVLEAEMRSADAAQSGAVLHEIISRISGVTDPG